MLNKQNKTCFLTLFFIDFLNNFINESRKFDRILRILSEYYYIFNVKFTILL